MTDLAQPGLEVKEEAEGHRYGHGHGHKRDMIFDDVSNSCDIYDCHQTNAREGKWCIS